MMKKTSTKFLALVLTTLASVTVLTTLAFADDSSFLITSGDNSNEYSIIINKDKNSFFDGAEAVENTFYNGTSILTTEAGGKVEFQYNGIGFEKSKFLVRNNQNSYITNTSPINGIKRLEITFKDFENIYPKFRLEYSGDTNFSKDFYYGETNLNQENFTIDFNGRLPNYFKLYGGSESFPNQDFFISEIKIYYSCNNSYIPVNVESNDLIRGSVTSNITSCLPGDNITVTAKSNGLYSFDGWYKNNELVSIDNPYSFIAGSSVSLEGRFAATYDGSTPIDLGNNRVAFGLYPQTIVDDEDIIEQLENINVQTEEGYYLFNGEYYANKAANPCYKHTFSNGEEIVKNKEYWFKCEPIIWNEIGDDMSSDGGLVVCSYASEKILDANYFNVTGGGEDYVANFENSYVQEWLNEEFFDSAFFNGCDALELSNVWLLEDNNDWNEVADYYAIIYMLQWIDLSEDSELNILDTFGSLKKEVTDYALASGVSSSITFKSGDWMLATYDSSNPEKIYFVNESGMIMTTTSYGRSSLGIVPVIHIDKTLIE